MVNVWRLERHAVVLRHPCRNVRASGLGTSSSRHHKLIDLLALHGEVLLNPLQLPDSLLVSPEYVLKRLALVILIEDFITVVHLSATFELRVLLVPLARDWAQIVTPRG